MNDRNGPGGPELPDFSGGGSGGGGAPRLPDFSGGVSASGGSSGGSGGSSGGPGDPFGGDPGLTGPREPGSGRGKGPLIALLVGGGVVLVAVLAIGALILSQTVLSPDREDPTVTSEPASTEPDPSEDATPSEVVPTTESEPSEDPSLTTIEAPTVECTSPGNRQTTEQVDGFVRGGGLEFAVLAGWNTGSNWGRSAMYMTDVHSADQPVEAGWYSVASVGAVEWPEEEGGYPGAEATARAIFQCSNTRDEAKELYGEPAQAAAYRDEAIEVDGHPGWIVSGDLQVSELALMRTTDAWRNVVIVVDTPDGPAVFEGGAALGHEQQVADLDAMIASLRVY